jgi:hypothetical protein
MVVMEYEMEENGDVVEISIKKTILINCDHLNNISGGNLRYSAWNMDG